jgi:hypothetical protein
VRGILSPFINLDERGQDTPHPGLLPLLPRKDFLDEVLEAGVRVAPISATMPPILERLGGIH